LDSGTLLATVQLEALTTQARGLVNGLTAQEIQISAPTLLAYELVAVTRKWVYRRLTTPERAQTALDTLLRYPVELHFDEALIRRGSALASELNQPTAYDAQYLALAERLSCEFWTADERLYNTVHGKFPNIRWLGQWQAQT
jgi:predicted nucleic acid-binding protein